MSSSAFSRHAPRHWLDDGAPARAPAPEPGVEPRSCDVCGGPCVGDDTGRGLLAFPRGDRVDYEEPLLCDRCAHAIGVAAIARFEGPDE